jgi:hypothetical protein
MEASSSRGLPSAMMAGSRGDFCSGSWPCKNALPGEVGEKPGPVRSQAAIAAISGLVPTMFMTRVRL